MQKVNEILKSKSSRRSFLAGAGALGATALVAGCNDSVSSSSGGGAPTYPPLVFADNDVLNFALNLEYLEAEFYLRAATGSGLPAALIGTSPGAVTGGTQVQGLRASEQNFLNELAQTELNHVKALRATITGNSGTPVDRPAIDLTNSFNALATAAGIGSTFDPFLNVNTFYVGAFVFEDVGVTAYNGAAPLLASNTILSAAAGIAAVEAYHAASLRALLVGSAVTLGSQTYVTYANQISALRGTLGGGNETPLSPTSIVAANATTAVGFSRTTDQVLHIVYGTGGGAGVSKGGFFPNGLNGVYTTTAA